MCIRDSSEDERAFNKKPAWQKAIIVVAGAAMNLLLCILFLIIIALYTGTVTTSIDQVNDGSPAAKAGIQSGDVITAIDEKPIKDWTQIIEGIGAAEKQVTVEVERDGKKLSFVSELEKGEDGRQIIGIIPKRDHNVLTAVKVGTVNTWNMTKMMGKMCIRDRRRSKPQQIRIQAAALKMLSGRAMLILKQSEKPMMPFMIGKSQKSCTGWSIL